MTSLVEPLTADLTDACPRSYNAISAIWPVTEPVSAPNQPPDGAPGGTSDTRKQCRNRRSRDHDWFDRDGGVAQLGRSLGKSLGEFKRASNDLRNTLEEEIHVEEQTRTKPVAAAPPAEDPQHTTAGNA